MKTASEAELIANVPFLRGLPVDARRQVLSRFEELSYGFGEVIVREGEPGDAFYILTKGKARVFTVGDDGAEVPLNVLRTGDDFGEIALLEEGVRKASVRCSGEVTALRLAREDFDRLLLELPSLREYDNLCRHCVEPPAFGCCPMVS